MKSKFIKKIIAFCCVFCMSISFCSCNFVDEVFDLIDVIIDTESSNNQQSSNDEQNSSNNSNTSTTPYIVEKTDHYDDFFVTYPSYVVCHVGDTFEINITASHMDTLTYEVFIIGGRDDYFSVDGHTVTALSVCTWELCAKVSELDIWYVTEIEVVS